MDKSTTITTIKIIIVTNNNPTTQLIKVNNTESKISKLNNVWNNYNKRIK